MALDFLQLRLSSTLSDTQWYS